MIGAVSGICWAFTVLGLRWLHEGGLRIVVLGNWLAFALALPVFTAGSRVFLADILTLLNLGIFQIALAYYCLTKALRRIPVFEPATPSW